jgi:hypothetical protein
MRIPFEDDRLAWQTIIRSKRMIAVHADIVATLASVCWMFQKGDEGSISRDVNRSVNEGPRESCKSSSRK